MTRHTFHLIQPDQKVAGLNCENMRFSPSLSVLMWQFRLVCYMKNTTIASSRRLQLERKGVLLLAKCLMVAQYSYVSYRSCSFHVQNDVTKHL